MEFNHDPSNAADGSQQPSTLSIGAPKTPHGDPSSGPPYPLPPSQAMPDCLRFGRGGPSPERSSASCSAVLRYPFRLSGS